MALPLSAKILAWLFVNLLLLGIVAAFVVFQSLMGEGPVLKRVTNAS